MAATSPAISNRCRHKLNAGEHSAAIGARQCLRVSAALGRATLSTWSSRRKNALASQTTRLTALGPLPFLSGSTSKLMCWPSISDLKPARSTAVTCTNTSRPPVVWFDEPVSALTVIELYSTGHCHRATPSPVVASPPGHPRPGSLAGHPHEQGFGRAKRPLVTPPAAPS